MRIKIIVTDKQAEVYIMDMETPALFIPELKREPAAGHVGLSAGNLLRRIIQIFFHLFGRAGFQAKPNLEARPQGLIMAWSVSNSFPEKIYKANFN
jgi:hypothetical protein